MTFHLVALYYFLRLKKFGKCAGTVDEIATQKQIIRNTEASFARPSGHLRAKPPVIRKHAAETNI
jgi:hypothetical protein